MSRPLHVLLVEDEHLLLMLLEDSIRELGHEVAGTASDLHTAIGLANTADFDIAVLDVNMAGTLIWPVVDAVKTRSRRFVLTTGYNERALPDGLNCPILGKPYKVSQLSDALQSAMTSA